MRIAVIPRADRSQSYQEVGSYLWTVFAICTTGGGRAVGVSRVGLPMLSVQAQPVRPSREEQTCQTLVSGRRPCEPKHPSPRLTALAPHFSQASQLRGCDRLSSAAISNLKKYPELKKNFLLFLLSAFLLLRACCGPYAPAHSSLT